MSAAEPSQPGARSEIAPDAFRRAMGHLPTGVTVVTAAAEGVPSGLTANAVVSLSLTPPLMLACLDRSSRTLRAVAGARRFAINVLGAQQEHLATAFASKAPQEEKWRDVEWTQRAGLPELRGTVAWVACELREVIPGGDHVILTGAVTDVEAAGGEPLLFHRGTYMPLR